MLQFDLRLFDQMFQRRWSFKNILTRLLSVFVPKEWVDSMDCKDSSSEGAAASTHRYLHCFSLVSKLHPAASVLCGHQGPVILCISLYIYLNDTLDEQRGLLCPSGM